MLHPLRTNLHVLFLASVLAVPFARAQSTSFCSSVPQLQFPLWNETAGWSKPDQYETIQLADIDGDGQDELIARDADSLSVQHWDAGTLTWKLMLNSSAFPINFSNAAGWNQPERYQSISFVDIDGDGKAELVALDANNQLLVLTYDPSLRAFRSVRATAPVTLGPQTRFLKLGQSQPVVVLEPLSAANTNTFDGIGVGKLTASQLASATEASFTYTGSGAGTGAAYTNRSYRASNNQGWFYSVLAGDLDGNGTAEVVYPTTSRVLHVFRFSREGAWSSGNSQYFHRPDDSLLLALPVRLSGNGVYDLVISDPKGLTPYRWTPGGDLRSLGEPLTPLEYTPNTHPGTAPIKFSTLQTADLRDGKGEVVLAMLKDGLYAWGFNEKTGKWEQRTKYAAISENAGFGNYSGFGTIQTGHVRIGNDDRTIVIALAQFGLKTVWYTPGQGFQTNSTPYFPTFTGGQLTAYHYLSNQTGFSNPSDNIRAHYVNDYASISEIRFRIQSVTTSPAGVSQDDFNAVRDQLLAETAAVDTVRRFFDRTESFLTMTSQDQRAYFDTLVRLLALQNSDSTKTSMEAAAKVFKLITDLISAADPTGGTKAALTLVKDFNNIVSGTIALIDIYGKQSARGSLDKTVYAISENLLARTRKLREVNDCARSQFLANWGLMKTLTDGVQSNQIVYDSAKTAALERVHRAAYELELWQALAPTKWLVDNLCDSDSIPSAYKYVIKPVRDEWTGCVGFGFTKATGMVTITTPSSSGILRPQPPSLTVLDALYKGGYGVRLSDLVFGRNGWDLPRYRDLWDSVFSRLPQGDSPILSSPDLDGASAASPLVASFSGLSAVTADEASLSTSNADEASLETFDPDAPRSHVREAGAELQLLLRDVKQSVADDDQRAYEVDLLTTALNYVHDQKTRRVTSDNAIGMLEAYRTSLQPTVQSDNSDPIAQDHMARASVILNLLANDTPDNAPLHHSHP